jgi:hypothetical protein
MQDGGHNGLKDAADNQNASFFSSFSIEERKSTLTNKGKEEEKKGNYPTKNTDS